ncbi:MAG TPA: PAS domain S-box protein [Actinomycetota bacterium]|nr:PAS domain S-box protein [Actinomycetota bacterium]
MRRLIAVLVLLTALPLALLTGFALHVTSDALGREVKARVASTAAAGAVAIQNEMQGVRDLVESYAQTSLAGAVADPARYDHDLIQRVLTEVQQASPGIATAFLASPEGHLIDIVPTTPSIIGKDFSFRDWYRGVSVSGRTYISEAYESQATGHPRVVAVATMIFAPPDSEAPGKLLAILVAGYGLDTIQRFVDTFSESQGVSLALTDQRGVLLAAPMASSGKLVSQGRDPQVAAALRGKSGTATVDTPSGSGLLAYQPVAGLGWTITASVPERSALRAVGNLRMTLLTAAALLGVVLVGGLVLLVLSLRDRRRAEEASSFLSSIVEFSDDAIIGTSLDGTMMSWNRGAERVYGYTAEEVVGRSISTLVPPDRQDEVARILESINQGGRIQNIETVWNRKDGTMVDVSLTVSPILSRTGAVTGASTVARDITQRKRIEAERDQFFMLSIDMLCVAGFDGYFKQLNPVWEKTLGFTLDELKAQPFLNFVHPADRAATLAEAQKLAAGSDTASFENRYRCKDGTYRWMLWSATPSVERNVIYAVARDITGRKVAERRLAVQYAIAEVLAGSDTVSGATQEVLEALCSGLEWDVGAMWMADGEGLLRCVGISHSPKVEIPEFEALTLRRTFAPGVGLPGRVWASVEPAWIPDVVSDSNFPRASTASKEGLHGAFAVPILMGDQFLGVMEFFSHEIREPDADLLQMMEAIGSQIGQFIERERAKEALRRNEETLRAVFAASPDIFMTLGPVGEIGPPSPAVHKILGYSPEEYAGMDRLELVHPDDRGRAAEAFQAAIQGDRSLEIRFRVRHADGHWVMLEARGQAMLDDEGKPRGVIMVSRDVTERVALEEALQRAKEEAERAQQVAEQANRAKSEFLSRMSHELRTPLNAVLGFGQLLEMDGLDPDQLESVHQILKGGRHLLDLINEVLDIARIETGRIALSPEPVQVKEALSSAVELVRPIARERGIRIETEEREISDQFVMADRQRLRQVLLNLLSNAVKYNREGGGVTIRAAEVRDVRLRISVSDEGPGIALEKMDRLFTPFDRLGAESTGVEGTGLGLALSKRLAEAMGGNISVESVVGRGTTFSVELPLTESPEARYERGRSEPGSMPSMPAGIHTLLQIEDNPANLKLVERVLENMPDVNLISAPQGRLGVDLARQHQPHAILLDLNLPDLSGFEVLRILRADPATRDIPVIVISADATRDQIKRLLDAGARAYVTKPLDVAQFVQVVGDALLERGLDRAQQ